MEFKTIETSVLKTIEVSGHLVRLVDKMTAIDLDEIEMDLVTKTDDKRLLVLDLVTKLQQVKVNRI